MSTARPTVLVTGAGGFVGVAVCAALAKAGYRVRAATRNPKPLTGKTVHEQIAVGDIGAGTDWVQAVQGAAVVVHLAARVHVMHDREQDPLAAYREVNTRGTERLARSAAEAGARRFVYVSTIKVNGEATGAQPFRESDPPAPRDPYGMSKLEAEQCLQKISADTRMETAIVRPSLVYGPGVKGNFLSMMRVLRRGMPLPLANCTNRRSLVGLSNLADLLVTCASHPAAAGQVFLAADGEDLSTPDLLRRIAHSLGRKARLLPMPTAILKMLAILSGRPGIYDRLCGSLQVDARKARNLLGWSPPKTVDEELARTARWYLASEP